MGGAWLPLAPRRRLGVALDKSEEWGISLLSSLLSEGGERGQEAVALRLRSGQAHDGGQEEVVGGEWRVASDES